MGGYLLDIHPEPEHHRVSVRTASGVQHLGELDDTAYIRDILNGRAAIQAMVRAGQFVQEKKLTFDHTGHASDLESWLKHRSRAGSRSVLDPALLGKLRSLLARYEGEILITGRAYAGRLRREDGRQPAQM